MYRRFNKAIISYINELNDYNNVDINKNSSDNNIYIFKDRIILNSISKKNMVFNDSSFRLEIINIIIMVLMKVKMMKK